MTKAEIINDIALSSGSDRIVVKTVLESTMETIKNAMGKGENVYLRGFGSFFIKHKAQKPARNITKKTNMIIPAHNVPAFKPAKTFVNNIKSKVK